MALESKQLCLLSFLFINSQIKLCFSQIPIHLLCSIPHFDYFNLTTAVWKIDLDSQFCLPPKSIQGFQNTTGCSILFGFCMKVDTVAPCKNSSSICHSSKTANFSLGAYSENPFHIDDSERLNEFKAKYYNGSPYTTRGGKPCQLRTTVTMNCNSSTIWPVYNFYTPILEAPDPRSLYYDADACEMLVEFDYAGACEQVPERHFITAGSIVILVFLCGFLLYLVAGSVINVTQGHTGLEIIPNYSFWSMLPFYIRDGCKLVFCCSASPSSSGYNAI